MTDKSIRISEENHQWLEEKSEETQLSIKSIVSLGIKSLQGKKDTGLSLMFRDKKGKK